MRLEWLEDILAVAATGSFVKAAERRHLTQPAFSRRIKVIEEFFGTELFDRSRKPVELKAVVLDRQGELAELAAALRSLVTDLRQQGRSAQRRIVIASQHSVAVSVAPSIVRRLTLTHDLRIRLRSANRDDCCALLLTGQADIALLYVTDEYQLDIEGQFIEIINLRSDKLIPVYNASISDDLQKMISQGSIPVVVYPEDVFLGKVMVRNIFPALVDQLTLIPKVETALTLAALQMAHAGVGVAWLPEALAQEHIQSGLFEDFSAALGAYQLQLVAVRGRGARSHAIDSYWKTITEPCQF